MADKSKLWGVLAQYENPHAIYKACEKVRDLGYSAWDACTPFPVHGLDKAMGVKPTKLPWAVLCVGLAGSTFMLFFESWATRAFLSTLVLCSPVFFAGIVFVSSFAKARFEGAALGSNLFGSLAGGLLESLSMWFGLKALVIVAAVVYLGSAWMLRTRVSAGYAKV